ncbi:hypothetical protein QJQ45_021250 [Haematococcus lacustris]|nr:hypothetical protein QJQ45_021250 [Haematococcus lacustris]
MHAQLPSLAGHPAPFMQANTTLMPTHPPVEEAPEVQPLTIAHRLHMAWMLQLELVGCRRALTATKEPVPQNASQRFLDLMATAGSEVILDSRSEKDMVPVICIPSDIQSSLHQLPPPFLARFQDKHPWKMLWKAPSFPWSSMLQQWVVVDWFASKPGICLVLGLRAAGSTGPAAHGPTSLHTPQVQTASPWPPPFQHQGFQGAQLAATARQMPVTACGAATPFVATPAPPCGPGPKEGRQDCSGEGLGVRARGQQLFSNTSMFHAILRMMATATSVVDLNDMWDQSAVPVICMPCGGQSSLPELPPPFLVRIRGNNHWEMLWKASSFPWSSLLQLWEMVVWSTEAPGGHLVLWLRAAASTGSPAHGPTSLHTPQALSASPRPPLYTPHQQGQGAQLTATARQIPAVGRQAATPPDATPAPPCGPGPKEGRQDCSVQASAIMQAQLACPSGTAPGTQVVAADIDAAAPVVATGPGAEQSTAAAAWKDVKESTIKKWFCNLPNKLKWQLGLRQASVGSQATVLVELLVDEPGPPHASGLEKAPHLDCVASHDASNNWTLCAKTSTTVTAWVRRMGMQLTGRYKVAKAWSDQAGARLVLEVRPLPPAARNGGHATPALLVMLLQALVEPAALGQGHPSLLRAREVLLLRLGPGHPSPLLHQPLLLPVRALAPYNHPWPALPAFRILPAAPDQGPEDMEVASAALPESSAPAMPQPLLTALTAGGATAAAGLGTAEEGGPGPSQPAAGMAGAPEEDDPEVSQPAAAHAGEAAEAPLHSTATCQQPASHSLMQECCLNWLGDLPVTWTRPAPGEGQAIDVIEVIDLTQDEPGLPLPALPTLPAAPDQGPEGMEVAPAALPESPAPAGGAAAAAGLGTAEEGGPGPSQPAAGMCGAPDEDDPEVSQPAAAPAHAVGDLPVTWTRPAPGEGQAIDVIEVIDLTQDEPAPDQGPEDMEVAPAALPESSAPAMPQPLLTALPAGGAAAAAGLGTAEEGGPGPSQPAAGMAGAPDEDDPEVSQPAAAPAHAGEAAEAPLHSTATCQQPASHSLMQECCLNWQSAMWPPGALHPGVEGAGGCSLGASHDGLLPDAAAPPCQASVAHGTAQHMSAALLAPPGTPDTGSTASLHSQPATLASCPAPCLALGGDSASSPEPAGGQQDGALSSDAEEVALPLSGAGLAAGPLPLPSWVNDMVNRANEVQLSLQHNPANWDRAPEPRSDDASHYLLSFISQPAPTVDWKEQTMEFVIPVRPHHHHHDIAIITIATGSASAIITFASASAIIDIATMAITAIAITLYTMTVIIQALGPYLAPSSRSPPLPYISCRRKLATTMTTAARAGDYDSARRRLQQRTPTTMTARAADDRCATNEARCGAAADLGHLLQGSVHALGRRHDEPCKKRPALTPPTGQPLDAATAAHPTTRPYGPATRHKSAEPLVPRNLAGCYRSTAVPAAPVVPPPPKPTSQTHRAVSAGTKGVPLQPPSLHQLAVNGVASYRACDRHCCCACGAQCRPEQHYNQPHVPPKARLAAVCDPQLVPRTASAQGQGLEVRLTFVCWPCLTGWQDVIKGCSQHMLHAVHGQVPMDRDVAGPLPAPGPAAGPGYVTGAAGVEPARNGVDLLPNVSWGRYLLKSNVPDNGQTGGTDTRCFELLYKPIAQDLGLDLKAGAGVDILVALALEEPREDPTKHADLACGDLQLLCVAKPNSKKTKWRFNTAHMNKKFRDWVKSVGAQLTGRFKAMPKQHGPHLLVLEVRPLPQAAAQAGCATPGARDCGTTHKRKAAEAQLGQSLEAGQAVAAAAIKKRLTVEPSVSAGVALPGGAAAAGGLGTAEEGGPGPSQPAAGMAGAPDEDDPEVSQPAAAPAHAAHDPGPMPAELPSGHSALPRTSRLGLPAAAVVATARPEADPPAHTDSWTQLNGFTDRSLEYLPKPLALQFKLDQGGVDTVELLVVLVHSSGSIVPGCPQLPYDATRRPDGRWSLKARHPQSMRIPTWVKSRSLSLTGRCKAQRAERGQAKERLLVLEVRPLTEAAASVDHATPGQSGVPRGTGHGQEALPAGEPAGALGTSGAGGRLFVADAMASPIQALGSGAALVSTLAAAGPVVDPAPPLRNMGTQGQQRPGAQQVAAYGHVAAGATKASTPPDGASHSLCDRQSDFEHGAVPGEESSLGPGYRTGQKRKAADAKPGPIPEAGQAAAAAAVAVKRRHGSGPHEPNLVAGVAQPAPAQGRERMEVAAAALPESPAPAVPQALLTALPAGGAAAATRLGTAEEGGSGTSQPAAGMAGAPDEGDPEVSEPAAAPAHAGLDPGSGQDTIDLTQEGPGGSSITATGGRAATVLSKDTALPLTSTRSGICPSPLPAAADQGTGAMQLLPRAAVPAPAPPPELPGASEMKLEGGLGWAQLIDNIITVLDKHLPDGEKPKIADALNRMEQWRASSEGLVHLQSLAEAYTLARKKCARFTPKLYAWILLKEVEPLLQA